MDGGRAPLRAPVPITPGRASGADGRASRRVPILRDERAISLAIQAALAAAILAAVAYLARSILQDMSARGLAPGLGFLKLEAGFSIGEGLAFSPADSYGRAFVVGLANTLRVAGVGVVLATGLGLAIALARLSGNGVLTRVAGVYVDIFRNTPLLVQLVFWYRGVILQLPALQDAVALGARGDSAFAFLSLRGLALPSAHGPSPLALTLALGAGLVLAGVVAVWRDRVERRTGAPARTLVWCSGALAAPLVIVWLLAPPPAGPFTLPSRSRFRYESGLVISPEYLALVVGLVTYTAAFIAEVLRSGIQSVGRGQREAGLAMGLREGQLLRFVVLPQALRVAIPPLTSQYLNLTKNSSLAIAVGYPDMFNVGQTISNQTGQAVMVIAMVMAVYLTISLATSALMNAYARRVRLVER